MGVTTQTWRKLITEALEAQQESWAGVVGTTLTEGDLDQEFDDGFGGSEGCHFTLWTANRVYFPAVYDGSEWVSSAPRNPCDEKTRHVGGE